MFTEKGVKHLRRIQKFIFAEPRRYNMAEGVVYAKAVRDQLETPPCGTACCIAGASYLIANKVKSSFMMTFISNHARRPGADSISWTQVWNTAVKNIGLNYAEASRLFYGDEWPEKFRKMYADATTAMERAAVGVLRIEHFIKTKFAE